ncbi:MAG: ATP-binding protein [Candidatus Omnitrophica bacterium]|nr:ATP-binding protein [Candidatus Omnitrophota bacterium]
MLIKRELGVELKASARQYPVVTVTGPRQSGKTTLVKKYFPRYRYYNLEEPDTREIVQADPRGFLARNEEGFILDEIQRVPELLSYIQGIVDKTGKRGQFILTGSRNFELMETVTQSLAGRTALLCLLPLSINELRTAHVSRTVDQYLLKGFYPRVHAEDLDPTKAYRNYYQTYIERDLKALIHLRDLNQFQKFVRLCAGRIGQIFNASALASEVGVSVPTINSWISILQESYVAFLLQPYYANIRKRLIKSPKLYFYDVGLASYLLAIENETQMNRDPLRGALFENMVVMELVKHRFNRGQDHNLYFFRDERHHEIDVVIKAGNMLRGVEIKSSATFHADFLKGLEYFEKLFKGRISRPAVIHAGDEHRGKEFTVLNYKNAAGVFED